MGLGNHPEIPLQSLAPGQRFSCELLQILNCLFLCRPIFPLSDRSAYALRSHPLVYVRGSAGYAKGWEGNAPTSTGEGPHWKGALVRVNTLPLCDIPIATRRLCSERGLHLTHHQEDRRPQRRCRDLLPRGFSYMWNVVKFFEIATSFRKGKYPPGRARKHIGRVLPSSSYLLRCLLEECDQIGINLVRVGCGHSVRETWIHFQRGILHKL